MTDIEFLFDQASAAREKAHAPYSSFKVGASLFDSSRNLAVGCNVQNYCAPLGICAEASAIANMLICGGKEITDICVVGGRETLVECPPCGGCLQRILEFSTDNTKIWTGVSASLLRSYRIEEILPLSYRTI